LRKLGGFFVERCQLADKSCVEKLAMITKQSGGLIC